VQLKRLAYNIDAPSTVYLVVESDRIEWSILNLIELLLQRHLAVLELTAHTLIARNELFDNLLNPLLCVIL
jgi:hypothetical protein